ncbi:MULTISPECIES: MFS transporter [Burkholderia]|uniref:Major facilitator transporter n=1 Tax=Burkholderia contaminans TaxID=488447 RepID=A0A6P2W8B9_9BURK|nr:MULTISPECIES: MFS transporter [Burkholderia]VWC95918.1 major facilitator transporter [Burkholderia contaminans]
MDELVLAAAGRRSRGHLGITLTLAFVGVWLALIPYPMMILPMLAERIAPTAKATVLAQAIAVGAIVGSIAQPIFGVLSDHTRARWGMRKPWIFGGAVAGLGAMAILATARSPAQLALGWALMALSFNATLSGLNAILPDQVPPERLGFFSSIVGFTPPIGILLGVWIVRQLAPDLVSVAMLQGALAFTAIACFVVFANDRRLEEGHLERLQWKRLVACFWTNPVKHPDFAVAWLSRALVLFGVSCLQHYLMFFLRDRIGLSQQETPHAMFMCLLVATAAMTVSALLFGRMSDRLRRRKIFVLVAGLGMALGLLGLLACTTLVQLLYVIVWIGVAQGAYLAVDLALVTEVLPDPDTAAKDMGVFHLANVLPQFVLSLLVTWLTLPGGAIRYDTLFVTASCATALGALVIIFVKAVR